MRMTPVHKAVVSLFAAFALSATGCAGLFDEVGPTVPPSGTPQEASGHFEKALALEQEGDALGAAAEYRLAIKANPNDSRAWVNLGRLFARAGQQGEATAAWRKAASVNPNDAQAWNLLGGAAMRERNATEALRNYRQAIAAEPDDPDFHYNAALACRSLKMDAQAAGYYKRWLALSPAASGEDALEARRFLAEHGGE
jgi:tetratricopeptide (TPR) repeat protein